MGETTILPDRDIVTVLAGHTTFEEDTVKRLARLVLTDPRLTKQIARLHQLALNAGLDPNSPEGFELALSHEIERQLDLLVVATEWSHPAQVLDKPRADFAALLRACRLRVLAAEGEHRTLLEDVQAKLARTVRIAESARRRREGLGREIDAAG